MVVYFTALVSRFNCLFIFFSFGSDAEDYLHTLLLGHLVARQAYRAYVINYLDAVHNQLAVYLVALG